MRTIKIADGTRAIVDGKVYNFYGNGFHEACDAIRIPKDENIRMSIFQMLFAQHYIDLSEAYEGHAVRLELIPVTEGADECED